MLITEAEFAVIDTETTGVRAGVNRVTEIAAVKIRGEEEIDRFSELVNPGVAIPYHIRRLTGITTEMVAGKPPIGDILPKFLQFIDGCIVVGHNLQFDRRFLNAELVRAGLPKLPGPTLCTLRIARRLMRGLPSKSLAGLVDFFGITMDRSHRAVHDAAATGDILLRFVRRLKNEYDIETVEELLGFQKRTYASIGKPATHIQRIRNEVLSQLPALPGVYFMKGKDGEIIYIGKAKDLASRVRTYFTGIEGHPPRTRKLLQVVRDVSWQVESSELHALLQESRLIKEHMPRFNRAGKRYHSRPFLRLGPIAGGTWVTVVSHVRDDGAAYYGPMANRLQAEYVTRAFVRLFGANGSDGPVPAFNQRPSRLGGKLLTEHVSSVQAFLEGDKAPVLGRMHSLMMDASKSQRYERAARYRNMLQELEAVAERGGLLPISVFDRNLALVHGSNSSGGIIFVRFGLCVATLPMEKADVEEIDLAVTTHYTNNPKAPKCFSRQQGDEIRILAQWMYQERAALTIVQYDGLGPAFGSAIAEAVQKAAVPSFCR